ncbi:MAG TPA: hypothetical protein DCZ10_04835 [Pelotomaculum sp.]|nr:hypothetical protein [Pelotomaculum sp.]
MTLDEIITQLDIRAFFAKYGIAVKKQRGSECEGACPFCRDEKNFNFNPNNGLWKCWKCNESGNVVSFLKKLGHDNKAIKKILQEEAGFVILYRNSYGPEPPPDQ